MYRVAITHTYSVHLHLYPNNHKRPLTKDNNTYCPQSIIRFTMHCKSVTFGQICLFIFELLPWSTKKPKFDIVARKASLSLSDL